MAEHPDALEARPERRAPILQEIVEHRVEVVLRRVPRLQEVMMDFGLVDGANRRVSIGVGREQDAFRVRINLHGSAEEFHAGHFRHSLVNQEQPHRIIPFF